MDYADELGLKCFVYGGSLHSWSSRTGSLFEDITVIEEDEDGNPTEVVSEAVFANQDELNAAVVDYLKNVAAHPSFYGVSLIDEPSYAMFTAIGEVVKAITAYGDVIGKDIFIMQNLLPFARDGRSSYDGVDRSSLTYAEKADEAIYERYLTAYYEKAGQYMDMKYVQYDDYPFMVYDNRATLANYIHTHQITSDFATEKGIWRSIALQTYNNTKPDGTPYGRRAPTEYDMLWQTNVSLAFGVKEISYYTLRPIHNTGAGVYDNGSTYPLDRLGNPTPLFDAVKRVNAQMNHMAAALNSFEYRGVSYYSGSTKFSATIDSNIGSKSYTYGELLAASSVENQAMTKISSVTLGGGLTGDGLVLVSELYDAETGLYGYYVVNASSPFVGADNSIVPVSGSVTLTLDGFDAVQVWDETSVDSSFLPASKSITLDLAACEGVFIIPFNI